MPVYQIVKEGNPVLREKAKPVKLVNDATIRLLDNLRDTLRESARGVGLAAPQIGISKRVFVVDLPDRELYFEIINPELSEMEGSEDGWEGCLSVPGLEGLIPRAQRIRVDYLDREGQACCLIAEGYIARIFQHEYDHLEGALIKDRAILLQDIEANAGDEAVGENEDAQADAVVDADAETDAPANAGVDEDAQA